MTPDLLDMRGDIELWVESEAKVAIAVFFRNNPGLVDTLGNLAERLALPPETLKRDLADHVRLGVVRQREVNGETVYMLDRRRRAEIEGYVESLAGAPGVR